MSLRTRLILSYLFIVVLCLGIVAGAVSVMLQGYRDRLIMARLDDMTIPIYVQFRSLAQRQASWDEIWTRLEEQAEETGVYILLTDKEGNVVGQVAPHEGPRLWFIELPPGGLSRAGSEPRRGTFNTSSGQTFFFAAYPVTRVLDTQKQAGLVTLVLAVPRSGISAVWADLVRPFLWAGLIALGVSVVIAFLLARSVYRPVQRVTEAAEKIAQGQYDQEVPVTGPKDIRGLAIGFNQMAKQVKQAQYRLRYFVADVSHELRNPLTSIRGFAQAMLDGTTKDANTGLRAAQIIEDESKRMIRQVDELLELSRMQSGQIQMTRQPVDIKELLEHCQEIFNIRAEEKSLNIQIEIEPLKPVIGDIDRLEQVFSNLLDNALKHSPDAGQVKIAARNTATNYVEVTVADSGPGIPPEQLPYVFERFYQAGGVRTGTGLGLAIAKEIVLAHGGRIEINSTPGEGAEFIVTLPTAPGLRV